MFPPLGFALSAAFVLGVALYTSGYFQPMFVLIAGIASLFCLWFAHRKVIALCCLIMLLLVAGAIRSGSGEVHSTSDDELVSARQFTGQVVDVPRNYPSANYTRIDLHEPSHARIVAILPPYPGVMQGDVLKVDGEFAFHSEAGFAAFFRQRDTVGVVEADRIDVVDNRATAPQRMRAYVADEIRTRLQQRIPEPAGAFATGVILGDDGAMTESTRFAFRVGGLTHMTAVSGVHVGIIAAVFLLLSRMGFISRWWMLGVSVPIIWSFAYLVGMSPSVARASLMLTLLIFAHFLGRPRDTLNAVGIAAAVMLAIDPSFRNDVGFQLSVAATIGIALGILLVGRHSHWHLMWVVPISAQVATEPLILYHFGYYSLISPVANILATPFLALAMALSILTVLTSLLSSSLADIVAIAAWVPATAVVLIAETAASISTLSNDTKPLGLQTVWIAYTCIAGMVGLMFLLLQDHTGESDHEMSMIYRV